MPIFFTCKNCDLEKPANYRLKGGQEFCSDPKCQRARKAAWQKKSMAENPSYKAKQAACVNRWRQNRPLHQYQRAYRENHPEYVKANREKQRIRNARRSERQKSARSKKIVKMDTLFVELVPLQSDSRQISGTSP